MLWLVGPPSFANHPVELIHSETGRCMMQA
jgi:hypothetical protein